CVLDTFQPPARGELPLRLGGQLLALPPGERLGVAKGDVYHRMALASPDRALRAGRVSPVGPAHERPPVAEVAEIDRARGLHEDERPGIQHVRQGAGIVRGIRRNLGEGDMPGRLYEA